MVGEVARLLRALGWIAEGRPILEVAMELGYESPSAFSAMFRRELGALQAGDGQRGAEGGISRARLQRDLDGALVEPRIARLVRSIEHAGIGRPHAAPPLAVDPRCTVERVDLETVVTTVLDQTDLVAIAEEVIDGVDLPEIIRESTGSMASDTVRGARMQRQREQAARMQAARGAQPVAWPQPLSLSVLSSPCQRGRANPPFAVAGRILRAGLISIHVGRFH